MGPPLTGEVDQTRTIDVSKPEDPSGKKILVVGGTSGLGRAIAIEAAGRGAIATAVGRSFKDENVPNISFEKADLSLMKEAKRIGETMNADVDVIVLTTGIIASSTRQESAEGIEMDMAVSYLSRLVILKYLVPRLSKKGARIFIMGFPGNTLPGTRLDDLNSEKEYGGSFGWVHMNTVAGNECLIYDWAEKDKDHAYFGLNPGLIQTGIRSNVYEGTIMKILGSIMEGLISWFAQSPAAYGKIITDLIFVPGLEEHSGVAFNPKAQPVLKSPMFLEDETLPKQWVSKSEELVKEKAGV